MDQMYRTKTDLAQAQIAKVQQEWGHEWKNTAEGLGLGHTIPQEDEQGDAKLSASTIRELRGEACRLLDPLFRRFTQSPEHEELADKLKIVKEPMPWLTG